MRILLDECLPGRKLRPGFPTHEVRTVAEMGWRGIKNGALLVRAAPEFDAFVTVDRSLRYQQDTPGVDLLIVVSRAKSNRLEHLLPLLPAANEVLRTARSGEVIEVSAQPAPARRRMTRPSTRSRIRSKPRRCSASAG